MRSPRDFHEIFRLMCSGEIFASPLVVFLRSLQLPREANMVALPLPSALPPLSPPRPLLCWLFFVQLQNPEPVVEELHALSGFSPPCQHSRGFFRQVRDHSFQSTSRRLAQDPPLLVASQPYKPLPQTLHSPALVTRYLYRPIGECRGPCQHVWECPHLLVQFLAMAVRIIARRERTLAR